jgi:hypothetical protein
VCCFVRQCSATRSAVATQFMSASLWKLQGIIAAQAGMTND